MVMVVAAASGFWSSTCMVHGLAVQCPVPMGNVGFTLGQWEF